MLLNRVAIVFKFVVYVVLLFANSRLKFSTVMLWSNALQYLTDMAIFLLIVSIESQFDSFKILRKELLMDKRRRKEKS